MRIVIAGGHGQIALLLSRQLADGGHTPVGLIRNSAHAADLEAAGAESVVIDLEKSTVDELAQVIAGADAVVFAAGAGAGSGNERKLTVDRDGAILLADAAVAAEVPRIVIVSSVGAGDDNTSYGEDFAVYLRAKGEADVAVMERPLDWTIIRPVSLTDDAATGLVAVGDHVERGSIPRTDVATIIAHTIVDRRAVKVVFEATSGGVPIAEALAAL